MSALVGHIFFSSLTPSFMFFTPSERTQNLLTTIRNIFDVFFIYTYIYNYSDFLIYTYTYLHLFTLIFIFVLYYFIFILILVTVTICRYYYYLNLMKLIKCGEYRNYDKIYEYWGWLLLYLFNFLVFGCLSTIIKKTIIFYCKENGYWNLI